MTMTWIQCLACLWTLAITQPGFVCIDIKFIERREGESVVLPCDVEPSGPAPIGFSLKRSWLTPAEVLFKFTKYDFSVGLAANKNRISVSGDPSDHSLNVTVSQLRPDDTDRYVCEFVIGKSSSEDEKIQGKTEFFLLVTPYAQGLADMELVETCAGGSAVIPCFTPHEEGQVVEGVSLKRQRGRAPVEVVYHSKGHHSGGGGHSPSFYQFPAERVQLSSASGPGGITYSLTLRLLQPEDGALYSCQLLQRGRPDSSTGLGRRVFFVSVQGGQCGSSSADSDSSYPTLLYALSSAVGVLLLVLLVLGFVVLFKGKANRSVKSHPQAPIYEEMVGMPSQSRKLASCHLEEVESTEYRNCSVKKSCPENYYESPSGALFPRKESEK
ncbi:cd7 antigen-like [Odontesthes bonariensis]|uniref:cd7 antigen-like n=1 Tax=Odontesthes bonariensis TaxID=219752 RepID=UPI003F58DB62